MLFYLFLLGQSDCCSNFIHGVSVTAPPVRICVLISLLVATFCPAYCATHSCIARVTVWLGLLIALLVTLLC